MMMRSSSRLGFLLGFLTLTVAPAASADYDVTVTFEWDDQRTCVRAIDVDPWETNIPCGQHLQWCGGLAAGAPKVTWTVKQAPNNYKWWVEHKRVAAERPHFPPSFEIGGSVTQSASGNLPAIVNKGDYSWTYKVVARPDDTLPCEKVETDPQVVFNGGGGGKMLRIWASVAIAALGVLLLFVLLRHRRRAA